MCLTNEHIKTAESNGICLNTLKTRVHVNGWDIEEAITTKPLKAYERKGYKYFTKEQLEIANKNGISYKTLWYRRAKGKMPIEQAMIKQKWTR